MILPLAWGKRRIFLIQVEELRIWVFGLVVLGLAECRLLIANCLFLTERLAFVIAMFVCLVQTMWLGRVRCFRTGRCPLVFAGLSFWPLAFGSPFRFGQ